MSYTFQVSTRYSLEGSGKSKQIELVRKDAHAKFRYYSVPKIQTDAFLIAEIEIWGELGLLKAEANIRLYNTYVGSTYINPQISKEKLALTLGKDSRIQVDRVNAEEYNETYFLRS